MAPNPSAILCPALTLPPQQQQQQNPVPMAAPQTRTTPLILTPPHKNPITPALLPLISTASPFTAPILASNPNPLLAPVHIPATSILCTSGYEENITMAAQTIEVHERSSPITSSQLLASPRSSPNSTQVSFPK